MHAKNGNLIGLSFTGENTFQNIENLSLGFGLKTVFTNNFLSLPLIAKAHLILPFANTVPITTIMTSIAYAPSILSFSDAKTYKEFKLEADMEIISNVHIFTGYRNIDTEYYTYNKTFNNSFYAGLKLSF